MLKQVNEIIKYFESTNLTHTKKTRRIVENIINSAIQQDREERALAKRMRKYSRET